MINLSLFAGFLLCLASTFVKGTFNHPRLVVLAVAGLTGMYMVHLLADDYNTYQTISNRPGGRLLGKRSVREEIFGLRSNATTPAARASDPSAKRDISNHIARLDMILRFDPTGCARKYVCTIATKSPKKLKKSERNVINMVRGITKKEKSSGGSAFKTAMELGILTKDPEACGTEYPKCIFTVSQMLRLMSWF